MDTLNIMIIEDNPDDFNLMKEYVSEFSKQNSFCENTLLTNFSNIRDSIEFLNNNSADIILLDLTLPDSSGLATLLKLKDYIYKIPIIILTGSNNEDIGIESIKNGAQDYLVKSKITPELVLKSIKYSIERFGILKEKEDLIIKLEKAVQKIQTLSGFLPICSNCKKIRNDKGYWEQVDEYIRSHSMAEFTHSICPECTKELYSEILNSSE